MTYGLLLALGAYLLGAVPFGLLLGRLAGRDIRREGSGNIGATNVVRVCGWKWGAPAFALDFLKGLLPVLAAWKWIEPAGVWPILAGVAAILGHNFPVWLKFKGGKGVATSAGAVLGLMPAPLGVALAVFAVVLGVWRYVSLGSISAAAALVVARLALTPAPLAAENLALTLTAVILAALVWLRHRSNISRLLNGTENRLGSKPAEPRPEAPGAEGN